MSLQANNTPQVYVVIGASRGIGLEYIKQLSARAPPVIVYASVRTPSSSTELNALAAANSNIRVLEVDLSNAKTIDAAAAKVGTQVDGVDVLIVNGAQWEAGKVTGGDIKAIERLLDVNVLGPARTLHAFLPLLRKRNTKKIINISSSAGSNTLNGEYAPVMAVQAPYNISKGALNILTRQAATELKDEGFIVVPLAPGLVATDMSANAKTHYADEFQGILTSMTKTATEDVQQQLSIIDSLTLEKNGVFISSDNKVVPW